jgi:hypothetical protein
MRVGTEFFLPVALDGKLVKVCPVTGLSHLQPKMLQVVVRI